MSNLQRLLLITPPFTQLNTPYPATAYIKGYLNTIDVPSYQADLGIEVINSIFSNNGLKEIFDSVSNNPNWDQNIKRIYQLKDTYIQTINPVITFLQGKNNALAKLICTGNYLPEAKRFEQVADLDAMFGLMGVIDKAKHLATLYLEDLGDFITTCIDPHFGFSRYAERISRSAATFDAIEHALAQPLSIIEKWLIQHLETHIAIYDPTLVCISVPFPGNLFAGFRCAQYIKQHYPHIKIAMGGGYPNTELRQISDTRPFEYIDYITLDDGERPLQVLIDYLNGKIDKHLLKRTFLLSETTVTYYNGSLLADVKQENVGTPDYSDLKLDQYINVIEIANPMHSLWSDGRWNKLTLAHGCYWGKCTFCDVTLDYIGNYESNTAATLVDRIETIIAQTGETGFHFVDEAAPPALMKALALELLQRNVKITWWTNIRFEKSFTQDLCHLLAASGCIAVSGGLEVASDRLLALMKKGVTVDQVAKVADNLTNAGIMVHAYLMYGFPTQTAQETVDALEVVRQLFEADVVQSAFWHQFAMTAHSPIGCDQAAYQVEAIDKNTNTFANNDIPHMDHSGTDHGLFSDGLKKALYNYMHGMCFDFPLQEWFDFRIPKTTVSSYKIQKAISDNSERKISNSHKLVFLGSAPIIKLKTIKKKGMVNTTAMLTIQTKRNTYQISLPETLGQWFYDTLLSMAAPKHVAILIGILKESYPSSTDINFDDFWEMEEIQIIRQDGLLFI